MEKKPYILVGLCGRSGSGKGYVSELFLEEGIPSIDTDRVYRDLTGPSQTPSPCMQALIERFGEEVSSPDGSLNRVVMRAKVFSGDAEALHDLNTITHRFILDETRTEADRLAEAGADVVLIDAPVLFESGFDRFCAATVSVTAPEETLLRRIMRRDGIDEDAARRRLATQIPADALIARTDFHIVNDCDRETLAARVAACADALRAMAADARTDR